MVGYESKNTHQINMCCNDVGLHDRDMLTILDGIVNIIRKIFVITQRIVNLTMSRIYICTPKIMRKVTYMHNLDLLFCPNCVSFLNTCMFGVCSSILT